MNDRAPPRPEDIGPIEFEGLAPEGDPAQRRRIFRTELVVFAVTLLVAVVLVVAVQTRILMGRLASDWLAVYVILGVLIPVSHAHLAILAKKGRLVEVRHWTFLLLPVHLVWGSGILVGVPTAVPMGIGLGLLDLMVIVWLQYVHQP